MKLFIIIAAHNEEKKIGSVLDDLKKHKYKNLIVVNDASTDTTESVALKKGATVLTHFMNRGQGAALATGNAYALRQGADLIVHFDADGQMQVQDIPAMIEPIVKKEADITIGSRFLNKKSKVPGIKKVILFLGGIWLKLFYGVSLSDSQCGFRALSKKGAQTIAIEQDGMEHASEILIETFKKKVPYKEVPVTIKYTHYSKKHSHHGKFQFLKGIKIALKIMFERLTK